jgi:hypothetical protein
MITFKSKVSGDINYHTKVGLALLTMMGRDHKVPSAMYANDIPAALSRLQLELAKAAEAAAEDATAAAEQQEKASQAESQQSTNEEEKTDLISLTVRAEPLLKLLQQAQQANVGLMWE